MSPTNVKKLIVFIIVILLMSVAGYGYYTRPHDQEPEYLTILHTNDVHGRLVPFYYKDSPDLLGGLPRRAYLIEHIEGANKCALTVDAGDFAQGSLFFNLFNGIPDGELMSSIGYDAGTLGNHEFDKGLTFLKDMLKHVQYPIVAANITFPDDPELQSMVKPYIIKDICGEKVAITGLVPADLKDLSNVKGVEVYDSVESLRNVVKQVNSEADLIVVLSHSGVLKDLEIAKYVPEVDVIVGGHSHTLLKQPRVFTNGDNATLVAQAGELGVNLGRLDLKFRNKKIEDFNYELIPVNNDVEADKATYERISALEDQTRQFTDNIIGELAVPLNSEEGKTRSSLFPAGTLVDAAIKAKIPNAEIVLQNSGGIRLTKSLGPGKISLADITMLFPFDNTIVDLELTGKDLKSVLETSARLLPEENGGFLQSLGLEYSVNINENEGNRVSNILVNQKPLQLERYYKMAINSYIYEGGNGFAQFANAKNVHKSDIQVRDAIVDYIKKNSPVKVKVQDKINFVGL